MGKVHDKLSQISTLATRSLSAPEGSGTTSKPRDDGSPTSTDSSTSTLKEEGSAENIPILVGSVDSTVSSLHETGKPLHGMPSSLADSSLSEVVDSGALKAVSTEKVEVLLNGKTEVEKMTVNKKDGGVSMKELKLNNGSFDGKEVAKSDDEKTSKRLDRVKAILNSADGVKQNTYNEKSSRFDELNSNTNGVKRSRNYAGLDGSKPVLDGGAGEKAESGNNPSTSRASSQACNSFEAKDLKIERRFGRYHSEELTKTTDRSTSPSLGVQALSRSATVSHSSTRSPSATESGYSSRYFSAKDKGNSKSESHDAKGSFSSFSAIRETVESPTFTSTPKVAQRSQEEKPSSRGALSTGDVTIGLQAESQPLDGRSSSRGVLSTGPVITGLQDESKPLDGRPSSRGVLSTGQVTTGLQEESQPLDGRPRSRGVLSTGQVTTGLQEESQPLDGRPRSRGVLSTGDVTIRLQEESQPLIGRPSSRGALSTGDVTIGLQEESQTLDRRPSSRGTLSTGDVTIGLQEETQPLDGRPSSRGTLSMGDFTSGLQEKSPILDRRPSSRGALSSRDFTTGSQEKSPILDRRSSSRGALSTGGFTSGSQEKSPILDRRPRSRGALSTGDFTLGSQEKSQTLDRRPSSRGALSTRDFTSGSQEKSQTLDRRPSSRGALSIGDFTTRSQEKAQTLDRRPSSRGALSIGDFTTRSQEKSQALDGRPSSRGALSTGEVTTRSQEKSQTLDGRPSSRGALSTGEVITRSQEKLQTLDGRPSSRGALSTGDVTTRSQEKSQTLDGRPSSRGALSTGEVTASHTLLQDKSQCLDERPRSRSTMLESDRNQPSSEQECVLSAKELKRMQRKKRRGNVEEKVGHLLNKAKRLVSEETPDVASVMQPKLRTSEQDEVNANLSSDSSKVLFGRSCSPKLRHRPTTPDIGSPPISDSKLLQSPDRMTRRKSEGMKPIQLQAMAKVCVEETLLEEGYSKDDVSFEITPVFSDDINISTTCSEKEAEETSAVKLAHVGLIVKKNDESEEEVGKVEDRMTKASASGRDISRPQSRGANTSPTQKGPSNSFTSSSSFTMDRGEKGEKVSSRPSSRTSYRQTSTEKENVRQTSSEKENVGMRNIPSSLLPSTPSKYTSCTSNAFTSNNSPFSAEETRPYTSVLRRSESTRRETLPASSYKSISSLTFSLIDRAWRDESSTRSPIDRAWRDESSIRSPIDRAWKDESSTLSSPVCRLSANPVRGRVSDMGEWTGRTSPSCMSSSADTQNAGEKSIHLRRATVNTDVPLGKSETQSTKRKTKDSSSTELRSASPTSLPPTKASAINSSMTEVGKTNKEEKLQVNMQSRHDPSTSFGTTEGKTTTTLRSSTSPSTSFGSTEGKTTTTLRSSTSPMNRRRAMTSAVVSETFSSNGKDSSSSEMHSASPRKVSLPHSKAYSSKLELGKTNKEGEKVEVNTQSSQDYPSPNFGSTGRKISSTNTSITSPRRGFVKREEMVYKPDDGASSKEICSSALITPSASETSLSHSVLDVTGPDIVVELPSSPNPPPSSTSTNTNSSASLLEGGVVIRGKSPLSSHKRHSWRQTPEISPDVVDMILNGALFDDDEDVSENPMRQKLATCVEEDEDIVPTEKFKSKASQSLCYDDNTIGRVTPLPDPFSISLEMRSYSISRLNNNFLSHSCSTPDLTQIAGTTKKGSKSKRLDKSNSRRLLGRVRVDTYLDSTTSFEGQAPSSPSRKAGSVTLNPSRHSGSSLSSRIRSSFSRWGERDRDRNVEIKSRGSRTLK